MKPNLSKFMDINDFNNNYWLLKELKDFCWDYGFSSSGSKEELTKRVATFIETGEILAPDRAKSKPKKEDAVLSFDTVITENHKCSQKARAFFESVIPNFHFSTYIQNFFKANIGKTYRDAYNAWYEEEERKKNPNYKTTIGKQFEYNQFNRDYFSDPANRYKTRDQMVEAWNEIKSQAGSNKYIRQ